MEKQIILPAQHVHLWRVFIPEFLPQLAQLFPLLNETEVKRAKRFKFDIHRQRYIIARALLRNTLSLYLKMPAAEIAFQQGPRGKPFLQPNPAYLQFNVSHSHDAAVFAVTLNAEIGVDIEMIEPDFNDAVAERFFSVHENAQLKQLPDGEKNAAFYQIWAGKEAIIKALGEGLYAPLKDFSIELKQNPQEIKLQHQQFDHHFHLQHFSAFPDYQAAFAVQQSVNQVDFWEWCASGPRQIQED